MDFTPDYTKIHKMARVGHGLYIARCKALHSKDHRFVLDDFTKTTYRWNEVTCDHCLESKSAKRKRRKGVT